MSDLESLASSMNSASFADHRDPQTYQKHEESPTASPTEAPGHGPSLGDETSLGEKQTLSDKRSLSEKRSLSDKRSLPGEKKCALSERRGLLSSFCLLPEFYHAREYSPKQKWTIVAIIGFAAITGPMGTSIVLPAIDDLSRSLDTSVGTVNVSVGIYLLSLGFFPVWWSNFSEIYGRRSVYVVSYTIFLAFSIGCALAPSISALIVLRLFAGVGASAIQACGAGTISDLYVQEERGSAFGFFYLGPLLGPFLSPIIGGAVAEAWGWRATMWVMVIMCGCNLVSIVTLLPETLLRENVDLLVGKIEDAVKETSIDVDLERVATNLSQSSSLRRAVLDDTTPADIMAPNLSRMTTANSAYSRRVKELELQEAENKSVDSNKSWSTHTYDAVIRPLHALVLLSYPPVLFTILFSAMTFMGIYFINISISNTYSDAPYGYSPIIVGLFYIPNSVTYVIASVLGGRWNDWLIKRYARLNGGDLRPESRISWNMVLAVALFPPACLIFGWCLDKKQMWVTPLIGSALFGFASMMVIGTTSTYLIDVLPGKGATGIALNNLVRQCLAAVATFVTEPLISALGIGPLFSIYTGVACAFSLCFLYVKLRGAAMRETYDITKFYSKL